MNWYGYAYERKGYGEHSCFNQIKPMQKRKASTVYRNRKPTTCVASTNIDTKLLYRSTQNPMPKRIVGLKMTQSSFKKKRRNRAKTKWAALNPA